MPAFHQKIKINAKEKINLNVHQRTENGPWTFYFRLSKKLANTFERPEEAGKTFTKSCNTYDKNEAIEIALTESNNILNKLKRDKKLNKNTFGKVALELLSLGKPLVH